MDEKKPKNMRLRLALVALPILAITAANIVQLINDPNVTKPVIKVFGPSPLGMPPGAIAVLLFAAFIAPLCMMGRYLWSLGTSLHAIDGRTIRSDFGLIAATRRNWSVPKVRWAAQRALIWIAVFAVIVAAWIIATAAVGA